MSQRRPFAAVRRNVLVAVAGHTPAIITETLWALEYQCGVRIDEIRVITTAQGRESVLTQLLGEDGQFAQYCSDYNIAPGRIAFSAKSVYVLKDPVGNDLQDIRDNQENLAAADQIFSLIREWCKREEEVLYCSVAGGRKTLGIYLAMALMLCGRQEDSLSHVLVSPHFEAGITDFFYPPPQPRFFKRLLGVDSTGREICERVPSGNACIDLADIPFPRLREVLGGELPLEQGLTDAVSHSQLILSYLQRPPVLQVYFREGLVRLGQFSFRLSRQLIAVYAAFLLAFNGKEAGATIGELFSNRKLIADLERRIDQLRAGEHERYAWEEMGELEDFRARIGPCISKVNRAVKQTLGNNSLAAQYQISTGREYGVNIPKFEIFAEDGWLWQGSQQ